MDYKERFIKKSGSVAREGRQVYISPEFHTKIRLRFNGGVHKLNEGN